MTHSYMLFLETGFGHLPFEAAFPGQMGLRTLTVMSHACVCPGVGHHGRRKKKATEKERAYWFRHLYHKLI